MPTKKKTTSGPKATLMKKNLAQLKAQAKKLKIKGFSTKKKEALVNSIMMAQARKKKSSAPKKSMAAGGKRMMKKRGAKPNKVMRRPVRPMAQRRRPMMSEYNGWKNYETWYINLHYGDYYSEIYEDMRLETDEDWMYYADYFKETTEDILLYDEAAQYMDDIQKGIISAFLSEVDYDEIAKNVLGDY